MLSVDEIKKRAAIHAAGLVKAGTTLGLGSGSTVHWLIQELGMKVKAGLNFVAVPTSTETDTLARSAGITMSDLDTIDQLDLAIDGADEIDPAGTLIKGGGGALLQEKIVAAAATRMVVIADHSKLVNQFGKSPLPVEVIPFGHKQVMQKILRIAGCHKVTLRQAEGQPFITDHHHHILDCHFDRIGNANELNTQLHAIPGLVETGLFIKMANQAIIGQADGAVQVINY